MAFDPVLINSTDEHVTRAMRCTIAVPRAAITPTHICYEMR